MNKIIYPINNHYSSIDLTTLKSNNKKFNSLNRGVLTKIKEIQRYSYKLGPHSQIIESKQINILQNNKVKNKSSYYDKVDMLTPTNKKEEGIQTLTQKYLRSFNSLDTELAQSKNNLYEFQASTTNSKILNKNVFKILEYSFFEMSSVVGTANFFVTPKNIIIYLFYFVINKKLGKKNFLNLNINKLEGLSAKLSKYFKKPIKFDLTQIHSVSNNTKILVHILGKLGLSRRNSFARIIGRFLKYQSKKILFRKNQNRYSKFYTLLTGVYIKLGGRLIRGKIVPRRTVKKIQYGSLARSKSNYITTNRLTQKNKRGSFSFTVSIGHKFY